MNETSSGRIRERERENGRETERKKEERESAGETGLQINTCKMEQEVRGDSIGKSFPGEKDRKSVV